MIPAGRSRKRAAPPTNDSPDGLPPQQHVTAVTLSTSADQRRLVRQERQIPLSKKPNVASTPSPAFDISQLRIEDYLEDTETTHRQARVDQDDGIEAIFDVPEDEEIGGDGDKEEESVGPVRTIWCLCYETITDCSDIKGHPSSSLAALSV